MFQRLFKTICALFSRGDPVPVFSSGQGERISRFLTHRNQFNSRSVRSTAYYPPKDGRLSVYWTTELSESRVWNLGARFVAPARGVIHGRGDVNSLVVCNDAALTVERTASPHFRHVEICGWDRDTAKARLQALKIADKSILVMTPKES